MRRIQRAALIGLAALAIAGCGSSANEEIEALEAELEAAEQRAQAAEQRAEDAEADLADLEGELADDQDGSEDDGGVPDDEGAELPGALGEPIQAGNLEVTVHDYQRPADPNEASLAPESGHEHAIVDAEVCVTGGNVPAEGVRQSSFRLLDDVGGQWTFWNVQTYARSPRFPTSETVHPGSCVRGWITFEVREDVELVAVDVDDHLAGGNRMEWALDG